MKKSFLHSPLSIIIAASFAWPAALSVLAQNDNPTGVAGAFGGTSTTGGSYEIYTGNATRTILDLTVAGAVGTYPFQWARTMNSRANNLSNLGAGGGWSHSYGWTCVASSTLPNSSAKPPSYTVTYPDGRFILFQPSALESAAYHAFQPGVSDRFQPATGDQQYCYLLLSDGGKVPFLQSAQSEITENGVIWNFTIALPTQIIDPYGLITTLGNDISVSPARLTQVTEPAGRWLKIHYRTDGNIDYVNAGYGTGAGTITQSVVYAYTAFGAYTVLASATYSDNDPPDYPDAGTYTYQASNLSGHVGNPLISTCYDTRYPGPMKNIAYGFKAGGFYGQLWQEKHPNGPAVVTLTISGVTRTETRGDGPSRKFTYGAIPAGGTYTDYLLLSYTDFAVPTHTTTLSYDAHSFLNSITDANGNATTFTKLALTGGTSIITHPADANGVTSTIRYTYTDSTTGYYLSKVTDELIHDITYSRNTDHTLSRVDYPDGGFETFTGYNSLNQPAYHGILGGGTENYVYDSRGLLQTYTPPVTASDAHPEDHPIRYHYDVNDHMDTLTDPRGNITTFGYNQIGQVTLVINPDPDHSQVGYAYNPDGTLALVNTQLDSNGAFAETDYFYDDYKRLISVTNPTGHTTSFGYKNDDTLVKDYTHTDSNVTRTVLPSGHVIKNIYDNNFRKSSTTAGYGTNDAATTSYTYDKVGNVKTMKDPNGQTTGKQWSYAYDARNRLLSVTDPLVADRNSDGVTTGYTYDLAGNKKSVKPANDQVINYNNYDEMNRLTQMTVGQAPSPVAVTNYTWTPAGKLDSMTDPKGHVYQYLYDALNRLRSLTYPPGGGSEAYTYDFSGNLLTFKNRMNQTQTFGHDGRNRETSYAWDDGITHGRTISYDDASRMLTCNTTQAFITFTYFNDNLPKSQEEWTNAYGDNTHRSLAYTYDNDGNRATAGLTDGTTGVMTLSYAYTNRNQLYTVKQASTTWGMYGYDLNGNMSSRQTYSGINSTFACDALNRVTDITHPLTSGSKTFHYDFDSVGNRTTAVRNGGTPDNFGYDSNNELTSFQPGGGTLTNYVLDASGNRTSMNVGGVNTIYTPNILNQYTTVSYKGSATYDGNGNLKTYDGWTYTYDAMNRLTIATNGATTANSYYDGLGRQVARGITGQPATFSVWDGWDMFTEYLAGDVRNRIMLHGLLGDLLTQWGGSSSPTVDYFPDGLGNTAYVGDGSGSLLEQYTYDAFGRPTFYNGSGTILPNGSAYGSDHLFTGGQWHPSLGLYDNRARFLHPDLGRFLQPDPIGFAGDPANLYRYCGNNPANWSDPSGLVTDDPSSNGRPRPSFQSNNGIDTTVERIFVTSDSTEFGPNRTAWQSALQSSHIDSVLDRLGGGDHGNGGGNGTGAEDPSPSIIQTLNNWGKEHLSLDVNINGPLGGVDISGSSRGVYVAGGPGPGAIGEVTVTGNFNFGMPPQGLYFAVSGAIGWGFPAGRFSAGWAPNTGFFGSLGAGYGSALYFGGTTPGYGGYVYKPGK